MTRELDKIQVFSVVNGSLAGYIDGKEVCRIEKTSPYDAKVSVRNGINLDRDQVELVIKHFDLFTASLELVKTQMLWINGN